MFLINKKKNYETDWYFENISLRGGIPRQYYGLKDKIYDNWEIAPWELFIFEDTLLGEGSYSKVYLAKWRETFVAAKVINEEICKYEKDMVIREFDIVSKLHHCNIVQFLGYVDEPFIIILEYIPKLDLSKNIKKLNKKCKINIMLDILRGIAYIHNRKPYSLIHRDIKPSNILITNSNVAKITDFGLSRFNGFTKNISYNKLDNLIENDDFNNDKLMEDFTAYVGTEKYMAPECLNNNNNYTNKIDIYSCGILLYELFESTKYIINTELKWNKTPKKLRYVITNYMLNKDEKFRLDALSLIKLINNIV